jgi:predicted NACHT family NTPase
LANKREQKEYRDSLLKILENERHIAIRELAQNPLLLTIMVLVHRIDAVLPDERHVLYQKCIPTISKRLLIVQSEWWDTIRDAYRNGTPPIRISMPHLPC